MYPYELIAKKKNYHYQRLVVIKPFAIMRRNVLFPKTENGAAISGRIFTIVQTAKANALVVDKYLEYALENINKVPIEDLLPWSEKLPKELSIKQYIK